jgi:hypothetical protein
MLTNRQLEMLTPAAMQRRAQLMPAIDAHCMVSAHRCLLVASARQAAVLRTARAIWVGRQSNQRFMERPTTPRANWQAAYHAARVQHNCD